LNTSVSFFSIYPIYDRVSAALFFQNEFPLKNALIALLLVSLAGSDSYRANTFKGCSMRLADQPDRAFARFV